MTIVDAEYSEVGEDPESPIEAAQRRRLGETLTELSLVIRERDTMASTLTIAQERCTALHDEVVALKSKLAESRNGWLHCSRCGTQVEPVDLCASCEASVIKDVAPQLSTGETP